MTKGHSFLVWYFIDREDQESESGFLCKKHFFVFHFRIGKILLLTYIPRGKDTESLQNCRR